MSINYDSQKHITAAQLRTRVKNGMTVVDEHRNVGGMTETGYCFLLLDENGKTVASSHITWDDNAKNMIGNRGAFRVRFDLNEVSEYLK